MKKRGISPLIATVLILGFTVALAAIIMTWGTGFTKRMQEQTEETANVQITCATDVVFDVKSACEDPVTGGTYKLTIANNGNKKIDKFQIRFYKAADDVKTVEYTFGGNGIEAFGIESESKTSGYLVADEVKQIEAIPVITVSNKLITCASNIDSFGNLEGSAIDNC
ncbi:MAG: hypothetical protein Q8N77_01190 [Nanoarchaeota archaeon]|nr:hypothetical protein [Nanoarchaeota archaeon]